MLNHKPLYSPRRTCHSETEICNLFERHMKTLLDQKCSMINEITEWGNNLIRQIQENVDKQKGLVERGYKNQLHYLHTKHQEFLDTALVYEERKNREDVRQLLEQCHELKFELGSFEYPEQSIPFIQIEKEQQQVEITHNSLNTRQPEKRSTVNDDFRIEDNKNVHEVISPNSNGINRPVWTNSSSGDDNLNSNVIINDNMVEKCPACSMIFPSTMGNYERSHHVNQHFEDS